MISYFDTCPCAPLLANGWLSQYDNRIRDNAKIFFRYMDDIFRDIKESQYETKLEEINTFHDNLSFTGEKLLERNLQIFYLFYFKHHGFKKVEQFIISNIQYEYETHKMQ